NRLARSWRAGLRFRQRSKAASARRDGCASRGSEAVGGLGGCLGKPHLFARRFERADGRPIRRRNYSRRGGHTTTDGAIQSLSIVFSASIHTHGRHGGEEASG